jgi:hypothetical protein
MTQTNSADFRMLYDDFSTGGRRLVADVATQLGTHLGEVRRATNARVLAELPELARAPDELRDGLDRSTDGHITLLRGMLGAWTDPGEATCAPEAIDWAKDLARQGFPVEDLLKAYRIGHACLWQIWLRLLTAWTSDSALLAEASAATSAYLFIYVEAVLTPILAAHQAERERLLRRTQSLAEGELRRILRGDAVDVGTASQRLRYRLDRWHIGFIVWSDKGDDDDAPAQLDRACAQLVERLGFEGNALVVPAGRAVLHGWLSAWQPLGPPEPTAIAGVHIAFGEPVAGIDGFRQTHDQSRYARRVAQLGDEAPACTVYRDIAVSALLSEDVAHARDFTARTLGGVLGGRDAGQLIETVAIYQEEGLSLQRAAERLHVHRNTVAYRVRKVLEASGETDAGSLRLRAAVELARLMVVSR